jgi:predicted dehydrogenase
MTRWGFLGTGRVTRRMIDAVRQAQGACLAGIASRDLARAQAWADERGTEADRNASENVKAYDGYASMLADPTIDWVYIALPPSMHHPWTLAALNAGKHVLCEKPLCMNAGQANELSGAAKLNQRLLAHATAFPYHPRSTAAKSIVDAGELGAIRRVHVACSFAGILTRGHDHRTDTSLGGGCLLDLGWYCVMSTLWFTGLDCVRLRAIGTKRGDVWDQVQVLAELNNGAIAHWDCGFDAAPRRWIEIAGIDASWICDDFLRPLDNAKPRYWIHGLHGKSRTETIGEGVFQEVLMIESCQKAVVHAAESQRIEEQLSLAIETHRILDAIEMSIASEMPIEVQPSQRITQRQIPEGEL